jgi:hypothetical protein
MSSGVTVVNGSSKARSAFGAMPFQRSHPDRLTHTIYDEPMAAD